jgi:hypothetical protein
MAVADLAMYAAPGNPQVAFGASHSQSLYQMNGIVDQTVLWTRELSPAEVQALYNDGDGQAYPFTAASAGGLSPGHSYQHRRTAGASHISYSG